MTSKTSDRRRLLSIAIVLFCGAGAAWYITDKSEDTAARQNAPTPVLSDARATPGDERLTADLAGSSTTDSAQSMGVAPASGTATPADGETLAALQIRLEQETQARQRLEQEVGELRAQIAAVQREVEVAAVRTGGDDEAADGGQNSRRPQRVDEQTFIDAGIAPDRAADLARRLADNEMSRLYLRDRAIRENWINTPRYTESIEKLNQRHSSLRDELDEPDYEAFLYATGRPNRVAVEGVITSSPAQEVGLQAGDVLLSYDGNRIFTGEDLRNATTQGEIDEIVRVGYLRDGVLTEVELPRGPLGVRIVLERAEPGT